MILVLIAGIACFALTGLQLTRARALAALARLHTRIWPKESAADIEDRLSRAGANVKLTAERFMGLRVMFVGLGLLSGFTLASGGKRIVLALFFAGAASYRTSSTSSRSRSRPAWRSTRRRVTSARPAAARSPTRCDACSPR